MDVPKNKNEIRHSCRCRPQVCSLLLPQKTYEDHVNPCPLPLRWHLTSILRSQKVGFGETHEIAGLDIYIYTYGKKIWQLGVDFEMKKCG